MLAMEFDLEVRRSVAVDIGFDQGEFFRRGIAKLAFGLMEFHLADEVEGVILAAGYGIDGPEIDLVLAVAEIGDLIAAASGRAAVERIGEDEEVVALSTGHRIG